MNKIFLGLIIYLAFTTTVSAADTTKPRFRVSVDVSCDNEPLKASIESYIRRELRALGDVDVVTSGQNKTIGVIAIRTTIDGNIRGYALSYFVLTNYDLTDFKDSFSPINNDSFTPGIVSYVFDKKRTEYEHSAMITGAEDTLVATCRELVSKFDQRFLEPTRALIQELQDLQQEGL